MQRPEIAVMIDISPSGLTMILRSLSSGERPATYASVRWKTSAMYRRKPAMSSNRKVRASSSVKPVPCDFASNPNFSAQPPSIHTVGLR